MVGPSTRQKLQNSKGYTESPEFLPRPCSFSTRRISLVAEDELQEEDHLGKQSFVSKAILHW